MIPQYEHAGLALEEFPYNIRTEIPQLPNLDHRIVALLKAPMWRWIRVVEAEGVTSQTRKLPSIIIRCY